MDGDGIQHGQPTMHPRGERGRDLSGSDTGERGGEGGHPGRSLSNGERRLGGGGTTGLVAHQDGHPGDVERLESLHSAVGCCHLIELGELRPIDARAACDDQGQPTPASPRDVPERLGGQPVCVVHQNQAAAGQRLVELPDQLGIGLRVRVDAHDLLRSGAGDLVQAVAAAGPVDSHDHGHRRGWRWPDTRLILGLTRPSASPTCDPPFPPPARGGFPDSAWSVRAQSLRIRFERSGWKEPEMSQIRISQQRRPARPVDEEPDQRTPSGRPLPW